MPRPTSYQELQTCLPPLLLLILLLSLALGLQAMLPPLSPPPNAMRAQWLTSSSGETARWWSNPGWR